MILDAIIKDKRIKSGALLLLGIILDRVGVPGAEIVEAVGAVWNLIGWTHAGVKKASKKA